VELQRNFALMRDLDNRAQGVMQEIDSLSDEFLKSASSAPPEKRKELAAKIQKLYNRGKEYSDDKVQLSIQTYELVDKHIRRLDSDLARFESEIKNNGAGSSSSRKNDSPVPTTTNKRGRKKEKETKKTKAQPSGKDKGSASPAGLKHKSELVSAAEQAATTGAAGDVLDMPVDPNEPTYCVCSQVSYGQMIACDNPECPIEWFHIGCMGLSSIPKGKWYCPKCLPSKKK